MNVDHHTAQRISMLRFLLIAVVVYLHATTPPPISTLNFDNWVDVFRAFSQDQLGRICVPALTLISGYLLFNANLDLFPKKLYLKKARTLLIPFFIFNICYFLLIASLEIFTGYVAFTPLASKSSLDWLNLLFGLTSSPINNPLHFIRELFVLVLLAPIFGLLLRRLPVFGLALVLIVFLNNLDGHLILRDTMAVMFYIGGMAAVGKWDLKKFDAKALPALFMLVGLCAILLYFRVEDRTWLYLTAPLLVWPIASLLVDTRFGRWAASNSKYSFFIFLSHIPLIQVLRRIYLHIDHIIPEPVFIFLVPLGLIALLIRIHSILEVAMPKTLSAVLGGRADRKKHKVTRERRSISAIELELEEFKSKT